MWVGEVKGSVHMNSTLKQVIQYDIKRCRSQARAIGSKELFEELQCKYETINKSIFDKIGPMAKVKVWSNGVEDYREDLKKLAARLEIMIAIDGDDEVFHNAGGKGIEPRESKVSFMKNKVFIVHGHDKEAKIETARTLEHAGFETIILHEQPDKGETIIEKIEKYTDVAYAVILYTPCDVGRAKEGGEDISKFRARQNVVFEHGYLMSKLGRNHVAALVKGDIETPGDLGGIVYIPMDTSGFWKFRLGQNMKAIGLDFDLNSIK